ncbi:hypothetical protein GKR75_07825 [Providencia sp. wls1919]|nr:hypothetical protein [Providencia sp. wls1919]
MDNIKRYTFYLEKERWINGTNFFCYFIVGVILRILLASFFDGISELENYHKEQIYVLKHIWNVCILSLWFSLPFPLNVSLYF